MICNKYHAHLDFCRGKNSPFYYFNRWILYEVVFASSFIKHIIHMLFT